MPVQVIPAWNGLDTFNPPHLIDDNKLQAVQDLIFMPDTGQFNVKANLTVRNAMLDHAISTEAGAINGGIRAIHDGNFLIPSSSIALNVWANQNQASALTALKQLLTGLTWQTIGFTVDRANNTQIPPYQVEPAISEAGLFASAFEMQGSNGPQPALFFSGTPAGLTGVDVAGTTVTMAGGGFYGKAFVGGAIKFNSVGTGGDDGSGYYAIKSVDSDTQLTLVTAAPNYTNVGASMTWGQQVTFGANSPLNLNFIRIFQNRLWVGSRTRLYFTDVIDQGLSPGTKTYDFILSDYFNFNDNAGGNLMAAIGYQGRLIVFQQNFISVILPTSDITQSIEYPIHEKLGLFNPMAVCWTPYGIVFGDSYGQVRITDGNSISPQIISQSLRAKNPVDLQSKFIYSDDQLYIFGQATANPGGYLGYFNNVYVYRFSTGEWTQFGTESVNDATYSFYYPVFNATTYNQGLPELIYAGHADKSLYEGKNQTSVNVSPSFQTKEWFFKDPTESKILEYFSFDLVNPITGVVISCQCVIDGVAATTKTYTMIGGASYETALFRFNDNTTHFKRISFIVSWTCPGKTNMGIYGNGRIAYESAGEKPQGGLSDFSGSNQ